MSIVDLEREAAMAREEAAYRAMHQELVRRYLGQHVAIYEGKLVDCDQDGVSLCLRVRKKYPGKFVLITPVEKKAEESCVVYSPRLTE
jgi:hypothetical protein